MKNQPLEPAAMPAVTDECVIPWSELTRKCGAPGWLGGNGTIHPEAVEWARANGVTIRGHWRDGAGLSPSDAHRARVAHERAVAEHEARNGAWREHVAEQKRQEAQARKDAEAKREEQAKSLDKEARKRQAKRDAEAALAAQAEAPGPDYDAFMAQHTGGRAS